MLPSYLPMAMPWSGLWDKTLCKIFTKYIVPILQIYSHQLIVLFKIITNEIIIIIIIIICIYINTCNKKLNFKIIFDLIS
jgi:hypothetical protein